MPVIASKLIERFKSLSPEEQEELDRQATESLQSLLKSNFQVSLQSAFPSALQYIQEAFKTSLSGLSGESVADLLKNPNVSDMNYLHLGNISPPFYPEQRPPKVVYVYVYVYESPSLN